MASTASESVSAANTRSGEALMTRTAVSVRLLAGAPVALVDHARAERPGLEQVLVAGFEVSRATVYRAPREDTQAQAS